MASLTAYFLRKNRKSYSRQRRELDVIPAQRLKIKKAWKRDYSIMKKRGISHINTLKKVRNSQIKGRRIAKLRRSLGK